MKLVTIQINRMITLNVTYLYIYNYMYMHILWSMIWSFIIIMSFVFVIMPTMHCALAQGLGCRIV